MVAPTYQTVRIGSLKPETPFAIPDLMSKKDSIVTMETGTVVRTNECAAYVRYGNNAQVIGISCETPVIPIARLPEHLRQYLPQPKPTTEERESAKAEEKKVKAATEPKRATVFGFPMTAVIRWMGKSGGWTFEDAKAALVEVCPDIEIADSTIKIQLAAGAKGERGEPAKLSMEQRVALADAAERHRPKPAKKKSTGKKSGKSAKK